MTKARLLIVTIYKFWYFKKIFYLFKLIKNLLYNFIFEFITIFQGIHVNQSYYNIKA